MTADLPVTLQLIMNRYCSSCKTAWLPQADGSVPASSVLLKERVCRTGKAPACSQAAGMVPVAYVQNEHNAPKLKAVSSNV